MVQRAGGLGFGQDLLEKIVGIVQPFRHVKLAQHDGTVLLWVYGLMDHSHASPRQFLDQFKTVRARSRSGGCGGGVCLRGRGSACA